MSVDTAPFDVDDETIGEPKLKKGQRPKKRPSDFEIMRTILQRTTERKLPLLLQHMGEDPDILCLCSEDEEGFLYGSSEIALALVKFDSPELQAIADGVLAKLHGFGSRTSLLINIRDQFSELSKSKGETLDIAVETNAHGSVWVTKSDVRGQDRTTYYTKAIESLFHFDAVKAWCGYYRPLLEDDSADALSHRYSHPAGDTYTIVKIDPEPYRGHQLIDDYYPNGFRISATRGIDMLITKGFEPHWPYQPVREELLFYLKDGATCQMAHRVIGDGWRMLLVRPNSVIFPAHQTPLKNIGHHGL